jgi:hypothetical protein
MKRVSLTEASKKSLEERKEEFIHGKDTSKPLIKAKPLKPNYTDQEIKKASCYIPLDLWLKYKAYELSQVQQRKSVSLNGLINDLLQEKLKNY